MNNEVRVKSYFPRIVRYHVRKHSLDERCVKSAAFVYYQVGCFYSFFELERVN